MILTSWKDGVIFTNWKFHICLEILSGRQIKNATQFKNSLIEVDLKELNEEIIMLIQDKMFDESVFKKLRETPIEKFIDAPDGERVSFTVSSFND